MSNRTALWTLLIERQGDWIKRDDLLFVGGVDAPRRMRDLKDDIVKSGQYRLEERTVDRVIEYRLVELPPDPERKSQRYLWRCSSCQSHPQDYMLTQPSLDPRWRLGKCGICGEKNATFRKVTT